MTKELTVSGENIGPEVGTKGTVTSFFGSEPVIKWDKPGKYGNAKQVVDSKFLKISGGKRSVKPNVILSIPFKKLQEHESKWASFTMDEKGNTVSITKISPQMDENGSIVGDSEVVLIGNKDKDGNVNFTKQKVLLGSVPRSMRSMLREYFDSQAPDEIFGLT